MGVVFRVMGDENGLFFTLFFFLLSKFGWVKGFFFFFNTFGWEGVLKNYFHFLGEKRHLDDQSLNIRSFFKKN